MDFEIDRAALAKALLDLGIDPTQCLTSHRFSLRLELRFTSLCRILSGHA